MFLFWILYASSLLQWRSGFWWVEIQCTVFRRCVQRIFKDLEGIFGRSWPLSQNLATWKVPSTPHASENTDNPLEGKPVFECMHIALGCESQLFLFFFFSKKKKQQQGLGGCSGPARQYRSMGRALSGPLVLSAFAARRCGGVHRLGSWAFRRSQWFEKPSRNGTNPSRVQTPGTLAMAKIENENLELQKDQLFGKTDSMSSRCCLVGSSGPVPKKDFLGKSLARLCSCCVKEKGGRDNPRGQSNGRRKTTPLCFFHVFPQKLFWWLNTLFFVMCHCQLLLWCILVRFFQPTSACHGFFCLYMYTLTVVGWNEIDWSSFVVLQRTLSDVFEMMQNKSLTSTKQQWQHR